MGFLNETRLLDTQIYKFKPDASSMKIPGHSTYFSAIWKGKLPSYFIAGIPSLFMFDYAWDRGCFLVDKVEVSALPPLKTPDLENACIVLKSM